ncbi:hypothetical protein Tco_1099951, partial [Tanacetum coccineum]
ICHRLPNQDFVEALSEEEIVPFIKELGYTCKCDMLTKIHTDHMHQPWRTFTAVINRCISGKSTDFMFQADNREISSTRKENMPYPRFTKIIINHFIFKDKTISMRKKINLYTIRDDSLLAIKDSKAYKIYIAYATGAATPKKARKFKKPASPSKKKTLVKVKEEELEPDNKDKPTKKPTTKRQSSDEEAQDDEYIHTPEDYVHNEDETNDESKEFDEQYYEELYGDVNISLKDAEPADKEKGDVEMTNTEIGDAELENVNQEGAGNQVKDNDQATQKTEGPILSSFISSDYAIKYLNFDNIPSVDTKVVLMLDINVQHEVPRTSPLLTIPVFVIPEHTVVNPPEIVTTASSTTISSLLSSLFPHLQ